MPRRPHAILLVFATFGVSAQASDWPMWRHDVRRSGIAESAPPNDLKAHWSLPLSALRPAWPDQPLMPFDSAYEPVVIGKTLLFGSSRNDDVTAVSTRTGQRLWRTQLDGPVRFAPTVSGDRAYVVSDDGYLYCLSLDHGKVLWKFRGGPSDRKILGNNRIISMWPARGAPVVADDTVYFAAGIWPFMGIFIHAVDTRTGKAVWTNDGDGSLYMKQPHSADSFAGVAPQGPMAIQGNYLIIPGGRSVPAVYDRRNGKLVHYLLNENSKKGGGHGATIGGAGGSVFFNGPGCFAVATGKYVGEFSAQVVADETTAVGYAAGELRTLDLSTIDPTNKEKKSKIELSGQLKLPGAVSLMRAGNRVFVGFPKKIQAFDLPLPVGKGGEQAPVWETTIAGTPLSMITADNRLFVSLKEGGIHCFGPNDEAPPEAVRPAHTAEMRDAIQPPISASRVISSAKIRDGYAVVWFAEPSFLIDLISKTKLHVIAVDSDPQRVQESRQALVAANLHGERGSVILGDPTTAMLPPYLASLSVAPPTLPASQLRIVYETLRPYGGTLVIPRTPMIDVERMRESITSFPKAELQSTKDVAMLIRAGALPGAADWTHEHADAANSRVSKDSVVKAPLGVLWFGGSTHEGILPRHGHGPQPQVIEGRIIIEGVDKLRAMDLYTGRILWETNLPGLGEFYNNTLHQPGANARGTNYISTRDGIYVAHKSACFRLDPATGKKTAEFHLPEFVEGMGHPRWGFISVIGDYLIGGADPLFDAEMEKRARSASKLLKLGDNDNYSASKYLAVMDRHTGKIHWTATAHLGFRHNAICAGGGKLFAIDRLSGSQLAKLKADAMAPTVIARVVAFDLSTGKELWSDGHETFGTWLSYSEKHDILVEAGRMARDTLSDEPKGMRAYVGTTGKELWFKKDDAGPAMLHGDMILRGQGACDIRTGKVRMRTDPITGEPEEWVWTRNYGCNTPAASEHLLTFRSGAAGFYDLCHDGGTGNFGGFRSSCTNNLIVAGGVLSAPDYTRTCTCSYQNQCSIALVPMPEVEEWTFYGKAGLKKAVKQVGINFGAPGDRRDSDGTLWLEFPSSGGLSPAVPIQVSGAGLEYFRRHQSAVSGERSWVGASGMRNVDTVTLRLLPIEDRDERRYTVRLFFAEPDDVSVGERVFDVTIQGQKKLDDFDIVKECGKPRTMVVKEFRGIPVDDDLRISFKGQGKRRAVLCGIAVQME